MKALGTGFSGGVGFLSIEVITLPSGAPTIALHGEAQARAEALGIVSWLVSTSHEGDMAMASVIALGDQSAPRSLIVRESRSTELSPPLLARTFRQTAKPSRIARPQTDDRTSVVKGKR